MKDNIIRRYIFILLISAMSSVLFMQRYAFGNELNEIRAEMQKIQEENKALQGQLNKQNEIIESLTKKMEALENKKEPLSKEIKTPRERPAAPIIEKEITGIIDIPRLKIKGFADMGFSAKVADNGDNSSFKRGQLDLLITSEITDRVSFLAEPIFESDEDTNSQEFELERAELKYSLSELLNIKIGRMHTPLGYWNQEFHHGTWFQTTIFRPEVYRFEDDKGILPIHSVGIELLGTKAFKPFNFEYNIDVINGRGRTKTTIQNAKDSNYFKAINTLLGIRPYFIDGLKFGADIYHDIIPSDPDVLTRASRINELIVGGFMTYTHDKLELLGEVFNIRHDDKTSGRDFDTIGYYLQGSYKVYKFTPYYRFDFVNFKNGDPYFTPDDIDIKKHTLGLRWDILAWNALKFEYSHSDRSNSYDEDLFTINSSFTF